MCRVLLIDPFGWQGAAQGNIAFPNVGLGYIAASIHKSGHVFDILDLNNTVMSMDQAFKKVEEFAPDIVGISIKTSTLRSAREIGTIIKAGLKGVLQVVGGPHTKFGWSDLIEEPWVDMIFLGEGELRFPQICERVDQRRSFDGIPGILVSEQTDLPQAPDCPLIESSQLDCLPFPNYDKFPQNVIAGIQKSYPIVTSRGCVYRCTYCSVPEVSGRKFRKRTPENIIEELKWARGRYRVEKFEIIDDLFNFDMERCKRFCRALLAEGLNMPWSCHNGIRADRIDRELALLMFESGCRMAMVGVESADDTVLSTVNKGETVREIEKGIRLLLEAGIKTGAFFIIGLPGDSIGSVMESVRFVQRLKIDAHFNMLVPYPGTELWKWAEKNARILRKSEDFRHFSSCEDMSSAIETADFTGPERLIAYMTANTKIGKVSMLIPPGSSFLRKCAHAFTLYWRFDRENLLSNILRDMHIILLKMLNKLQCPPERRPG